MLALTASQELAIALERALSDGGHQATVLEVADGPAALNATRDWLSSGGNTTLLLVDVRLAGEPDGIDLPRHLPPANRIQTIYMAPNSVRTLSGRVNTREPWHHVVFPFSDHYLQSVVALALRSKADSEREFLKAALDHVQDAIVACDAQGVLSVFNPATRAIHGLPNEAVPQEKWAEYYGLYHPHSDQPMAAEEVPLTRALNGEQVRNVPIKIVPRNGSPRILLVSGEAFYSAEGRKLGAVVSMTDITVREQAEKEMRDLLQHTEHVAHHDDVTGLGNRRALRGRLERLLVDVRGHNGHHVLCQLDLDQFKIVNETCGHQAGDALLKQVAAEMALVFGTPDNAARIGGDDFVLILPDHNTSQGETIAERLRAGIGALRFEWQGQSFAVSASIGVVPITAASGTVDDVLVAADAACSLAKEAGRNQVRVYHPKDDQLARRHDEMTWVVEINKALEEGRFVLYRQPIVHLRGGAGEQHHELLLRMRDTKGNIISPGSFLPAAERYDLMPQVDRWVVRTVLAELSRLRATLERDVFEHQMVSVNLSGASLGSASLRSMIERELARHDIPARMLCFEITETAAIRNLQHALEFMHRLRELGCRFALDDFGSGLSSYGYLQRLPFDYLKIDGNFIKTLANQPLSRLIVESINHVAHGLNIQTVAEWVEDEATIAALQLLGVDYGQGYALGRPEPMPVSS